MESVTYNGPSPARVLRSCGVTAVRGEPVDVPEEMAEALRGHPDWTVGEKPKKKAKQKAAKSAGGE